ncbi:NAD(P)-dependent alcohol dehydrogenase [Antrihabitans stalactiti]|uniref:NAD(P)-dependent alcohol dehydrogenase n=1 Tax=Antrihabitans stalactiti TaxID=2584121 RepID=A0A848KQ38_9NOCA|nr:NAD(P)-dependent alcohol dehydrogenase [Antrihabitans stalactiti]NMN98400.1 NAD(P)-dependent alcohol dehydrogenase [Antrihabitans stalactiti]
MEIEAAVLRSTDAPFTLETAQLAEPGPGQILVEVHGVGFCHTDLLPRTPGFAATLPIVAGHEGAGIVRALGPGVTGIDSGTHVLMSFDSCGGCGKCLTGHPSYCSSFWPRNMPNHSAGTHDPIRDMQDNPVSSRWFGQSSFATHALATIRNVVPIDPRLDLTLVGPLGCSMQTGAGAILNSLAVQAGSSVVVLGTGSVGLAAVMAARVAGATTIVAVDRNTERLAMAERLGATDTMEAGVDLGRMLRKATRGGADYALDTTGISEVIAEGIAGLCSTGVIGLVSAPKTDLLLPAATLARGKTVTGILEGDAVPQRLIPDLIELWQQSRFPFDELVQTYPLSHINDAERDMISGKTIKPVLVPAR